MLLNRTNTVRMGNRAVYYYYQVSDTKRVDFRCLSSNEIEVVYLYEKGSEMQAYPVKGLYYMENLTPEDEGEIDVIDTDKLISMICFDEKEIVC